MHHRVSFFNSVTYWQIKHLIYWLDKLIAIFLAMLRISKPAYWITGQFQTNALF